MVLFFLHLRHACQWGISTLDTVHDSPRSNAQNRSVILGDEVMKTVTRHQ
ncbi:hypothetical protein CKA32_002125 [Geitlerinema sp. FC II]|nr:hypothetical protein [Geitlerinema sp. CS-897]PPT11093.1 hypothetical protein CKA32_002125 [Geitlerinema sp. FC II]